MNTAQIMSREMYLSELLARELEIPEGLDVSLTGIELDSRRIEPGDLFFACKGATFDGRAFIEEAIQSGARAVLVEKGEAFNELIVKHNVPVIPIESLSCRLGKIAARFFDHPARELWMMGITGTNGKTSCCQFIAQAFSLLGYRCGVSGTLGYGFYGETLATDGAGPGTTPDAISIQRIIEEIRFNKGQMMAMEVSSHGLKQNRVNAEEFDLAVFTNLSRDHLDYHGSMQAYGDAKLKLFHNAHLKLAIVNLDDLFSVTILNSLSRNTKSLTYSLKNQRADVYAQSLEFNPAGFSMEIVTPWGNGKLESNLLGSFNVSNLLATTAAVLSTEAEKPAFDFDHIVKTISGLQPVRGRMEIIGNEPVAVVVDYAHTPDALKNALSALEEHFSGKIWCVFGCGGDRDKGKRPLMAQIAERMADYLIITDDNPRKEPSGVIIEQILNGISNREKVTVESNRAAAIELAIEQAAPGDVVIIAGKGHEEYQDVGGNRMVFSDVKQARLCLNKRFNK